MTQQPNGNGYLSGSNLERVLKNGHFAVTAELGPPQSADGEVIRRRPNCSRQLRRGEHHRQPDGHRAHVEHQRGDDRGAGRAGAGDPDDLPRSQSLAMQSDLLGAYALGMRNLLCLSGDHQTFGNHPGAKNVFDMDSIQLVQMVAAMRDQHVFQCGEAFKGQEPRFFVGAARIALCQPGRVFAPCGSPRKSTRARTSSRRS